MGGSQYPDTDHKVAGIDKYGRPVVVLSKDEEAKLKGAKTPDEALNMRAEFAWKRMHDNKPITAEEHTKQVNEMKIGIMMNRIVVETLAEFGASSKDQPLTQPGYQTKPVSITSPAECPSCRPVPIPEHVQSALLSVSLKGLQDVSETPSHKADITGGAKPPSPLQRV